MADTEGDDHEFGGVSTDLKLSMVEGYLSAFMVALRSRFTRLWYIDAFAGTGARTIKHVAAPSNLLEDAREARVERRRGSAQIAIETVPGFDRLSFIDLKKKHWRALCDLRDAHPDRNIDAIRGEANAEILKLIRGQSWAGQRAVMFLDPYGMHVHWTTLEAIRATGAIDVWYLVSLEGLYRQASTDGAKITLRKRAAISRMLGTDEWEAAWYTADDVPPLLKGLDDPRLNLESSTRTANIDDISRFVTARLRSLFPKVLPPLRLKNRAGVPAFLLYFAMANDEPRAIGLATKIAAHILKVGNSSQ